MNYLVIALLFIPVPVYCQPTASIGGYAQIGAITLESECALSEDCVKVKPKVKAKEKAQLLLQTLPDGAAKQLLFKLFNRADARPFKSIMQPHSLREITILVGDGESKDVHLYGQVDRARTVMGKVVLARLISEPTTDLDLLLKRQQALKALVKNYSTRLYSSLAHALTCIGLQEKMLLNAWNPAADLDNELCKRVYLTGIFEEWNRKNHCCETVRKFYYGATGLATGIILGITGFCAWSLYKNISLWLHSSIGAKVAVPLGILDIACIGINIHNLYRLKCEFETQHYIYTSLYKRMQPLATTFYAIEELYTALQQDDAAPLRAVIQNYTSLKDFCENKNISCCLSVLKQVLLSGSFIREEASWAERLGDAVTAYALLQTVKDELLPLMICLGSIDAFMSVAAAYTESATAPYRYVFAEFSNSENPVIAIKGLYNPLVPTWQVKPSDIYLGSDKASSLLLTGPHGGGKSTYMKAIAYAVQLAQTFGIVPAEKACLTVFDKLYTYAHIKEELGQGYSTFMAEKKRLDEIQKALLSGTQLKSLTVIDEPLKGTMEAEGALRVEKFLRQVAPLKQSVLVMATHFEKPSRLEKEIPHVIANAHPELIEKADGSFMRTFTMLSGPNNWWFNDDQKRERYINWLTCTD